MEWSAICFLTECAKVAALLVLKVEKKYVPELLNPVTLVSSSKSSFLYICLALGKWFGFYRSVLSCRFWGSLSRGIWRRSNCPYRWNLRWWSTVPVPESVWGVSYILVAAEGVCQSFPQAVADPLEVQFICLAFVLPRTGGDTAFCNRFLLLVCEGVSFSFLDCLLELSHSLVWVWRGDVVFIF